jgi:hypothetical protein
MTPSLEIGNGNWAVKSDSLLGYKTINGKYYPREMSVTRATTATRVNASGLVELVPYNLVTWSEQFDNAAWTKQNTSVTANTAISPSGTLTADTYTVTSTAANVLYQNLTLTTGNYSISVYAKKGSSNIIRLFNVSSLTSSAWFDLNLGQVVGTVNGGTASIEDFGNGWYRCIYKGNSVASGFTGIGLSDTANTATAAIGSSVFLWGAQLVEGTQALNYLPTTTRLNIPRIDYSTGSANLLIEPERTNLALMSASFDNATYTKENVTILSNVTTAPDGTMTADKMVENTVTASHRIFQSFAPGSAATYTFSCYAKQSEKTDFRLSIFDGGILKTAFFNVQNGTITSTTNVTASIENAGNGWYRCIITGAASPFVSQAQIGFLNTIGDGVSGIFLWGAQLEIGDFATSYIPTTTASVTRNTDVISRSNIFTNGYITSAGGTWFVDLRNNLSYIRDAASAGLVLGSSATGAGANGFALTFGATPTAGRCLFRKYVSSIETIIHTTTTNNVKLAIKWNGTTADVFVNGVKVVNATAFTATNMDFIYSTAASTPQYINSMSLYPTPLSDTELVNLTTI